MLNDYKSGMTINAIAKKYHHDNNTVKKYLLNPNFKPTNSSNQGRKVKNIETQLTFNSISAAARWAKCGATTLSNHLASDGAAGKIPNTNEIAHWIELN
jgi:hypothetical protein